MCTEIFRSRMPRVGSCRLVQVHVKMRLRVMRVVSCVSDMCLHVMRVAIRAPHCVLACRMSHTSHACQHYCVSCVSAVRVCVFAVRVCVCASLRHVCRYLCPDYADSGSKCANRKCRPSRSEVGGSLYPPNREIGFVSFVCACMCARSRAPAVCINPAWDVLRLPWTRPWAWIGRDRGRGRGCGGVGTAVGAALGPPNYPAGGALWICERKGMLTIVPRVRKFRSQTSAYACAHPPDGSAQSARAGKQLEDGSANAAAQGRRGEGEGRGGGRGEGEGVRYGPCP
jgi:hypothetical protein